MSLDRLCDSANEQGRPPSLTSDFAWTLAGNAVYAGGQFATLMLLAKLLRPEFVGEYALGLAIVYPIINLTNAQLRSVMLSRSDHATHFGHYLGLRLLTTAAGVTIIAALTQILGYPLQLMTVIVLVGVAYAIESISDIYYARLQLHDRMPQIAKSLIARAVFSVLLLAIVSYLTRDLLLGIAAIVVGRAVVLLAFDTRPRTHGLRSANSREQIESLFPRFDLRLQRGLLWASIPLGVVVLLAAFNSSIPSYFIKHALGERELGIFSAITFMVSVGNMAVTSLGQAAFTRLARTYGTGKLGAFGFLVGKLVACGAFLGACGIVVSKLYGRDILIILFRREYADRADLLTWIMAAGGALFMAQFVGYALTAAEFYHSQVVLNIVSIASLLATCYWLVPAQGLFGAVVAMLIAAVVQLLASLLILMVSIRHRISAVSMVQPSPAPAPISSKATPAFDAAD